MYPGMFGLLLISLMEGFGLEATDFSGIIEIILNGIETAIGLLILGILALLSLLGLIPNPFLGSFEYNKPLWRPSEQHPCCTAPSLFHSFHPLGPACKRLACPFGVVNAIVKLQPIANRKGRWCMDKINST